jgi:hypothetical protein
MLTSNSVLRPETKVFGLVIESVCSSLNTYSEMRAAFPSTVSNTARYIVVPQYQCPVSSPSVCFKSPQNKMAENAKRIYAEFDESKVEVY